MQNIINHLRETKLKDLKGLHITGTVPVSDTLLNQLIQDFVRPQLTGEGSAKSGTPPPAPPAEVASLLPLLKFPVLRARTEKGAVILEVEIKV